MFCFGGSLGILLGEFLHLPLEAFAAKLTIKEMESQVFCQVSSLKTARLFGDTLCTWHEL